MKRRIDDERIFQPARPESLSGDGMLGSQPADIRLDPPSVPVGSSEAGAAKAKPSVQTQCDAILVELRAAGCIPDSGKFLSRDDLMLRLGIAEKALCGRLGPSGPLLAPKGSVGGHWPITATESVCVSSSGVRVIGYQLSLAGVGVADRLARRSAA